MERSESKGRSMVGWVSRISRMLARFVRTSESKSVLTRDLRADLVGASVAISSNLRIS